MEHGRARCDDGGCRRPRIGLRVPGPQHASPGDRRFITSRDPADQPAMPDLDADDRAVALASLANDSRLARDERRAGIAVASLPCPLLIVTGTEDAQWPRSAYDGLWLSADYIEAEGASHWGLVLNRRALAALVPSVVTWVEGAAQPT